MIRSVRACWAVSMDANGFNRARGVGLVVTGRCDVTGLYSADIERLAGSVHVFDRSDSGSLTRSVRSSGAVSMDASGVAWIEELPDRGDRVCDGCGVGYRVFAEGVGRRGRRWFQLSVGGVCGDCAWRAVGSGDR